MLTHARRLVGLLPGVAASLSLGVLAGPAAAQPYAQQGIDLLSQIPLSGFAAPVPANGNDCWGYVSPTGREYALMGLTNQVAFVDITNPGTPVIVTQVAHSSSSWCGIKVYQRFAYTVNETGGGIQVIDMQNIDTGSVSLVTSITANGMSDAHTLAVNPVSGYLYAAGSSVTGAAGGLVAWSLANPAAPVQAGIWSGHYVHEAQVVSYTSGPYAGREIAFCCDEEAGMHIVDVTNKANMFLVSTATYPGVRYCHQAWLSDDKRYIYINDELDGPAQGVPSTYTRIFDVSNINAPALVGGFSSSASGSIDHNLYVRGRYIYEANYRSGLRVFDAINPTSPVEVAWIDTYPEDDAADFDGPWSNYPFFPSQNIIISDINRGMFVVRLNLNYLTFSFPGGLPTQVQPGVPTPVTVAVGSVGTPLNPATVTLHSRIGGASFTSAPMTSIGGNQFRANLPGTPCGSTVDFYITASDTASSSFSDPKLAPTKFNSALAFSGTITVAAYDMETASGWTSGAVGDTATAGAWERGDPEPTTAQPGDDHTQAPGVNCWITGRAAGAGAGSFDVDGGRTTLLSPIINLAGADVGTRIGYWRWYSNSAGATPNTDIFTVDISNNGGGSWSNVEVVGPTGNQVSGGWYFHDFIVAGVLAPTGSMRLRFIAADDGAGSLVEAAVDDVTVFYYDCTTPCGSADFDGDGDTGTDLDIEAFFACLGGSCCATCGSADFDGDGDVGTDLDIESFFRVLGGGVC